MSSPIPTVHAIADERVLAGADFLARATAVFDALGGSGAVHLRARNHGRRVHALAEQLVPVHQRTKCWLVINDRVDVALSCGAQAVQLPAKSFAINDARTLNPSFRIGVSVHNAGEIDTASRDRADWVIAGSVFETSSHPHTAPKGASWIGEIARIGPPVIAIGGIVPENVQRVIEMGAHGVAAIAGIWGEKDPANAARRYLESARRTTSKTR
ncbi:MAG TPA: thiamine phosphate synthase [Gemmatimonadaceae bacterium]|nr:thiamine phosphate synthase [Gemmatimonadaceae bacterium]